MADADKTQHSKPAKPSLLAFILDDAGQGIEEMFEFLFLRSRPDDVDRR
jgi:hypothetical protein